MRDIFDEYCRDFERQRQEEASKQRPGAKKVVSSLGPSAVGGADAGTSSSSGASGSGAGKTSDQNQGQTDQEWAAQEALLAKMQIMDRMVNQNTFADVAMDFKYWDDTSDALRWAQQAWDTMPSAAAQNCVCFAQAHLPCRLTPSKAPSRHAKLKGDCLHKHIAKLNMV
jgi:hypothetical protein